MNFYSKLYLEATEKSSYTALRIESIILEHTLQKPQSPCLPLLLMSLLTFLTQTRLLSSQENGIL